MEARKSNRRPSVVAKHTKVRQQKHDDTFPADLQTPPRTLDCLIAGLGYAGLATYIFNNPRRLSPLELASITIGTITLGWGAYDLGKKNGVVQGASFALRTGEQKKEVGEDDWKGEFKGRQYETLKTVEKIAWLRKEEGRIREVQADEQLNCGKAYIAKEEAYAAYERLGGYGGQDWKRYVYPLVDLLTDTYDL
jgi:hypothetical protein